VENELWGAVDRARDPRNDVFEEFTDYGVSL